MTDVSGYLAFAAHAPAESQHWSADVTLRAAPAGTYVLVRSDGPTPPPAITADGFAVACARSTTRACPLAPDAREAIVALVDVGAGGSGVLRAAFPNGDGGWFSLVRVTGAQGAAKVDVRILSEALRKGEKAQRFDVELGNVARASRTGSS